MKSEPGQKRRSRWLTRLTVGLASVVLVCSAGANPIITSSNPFASWDILEEFTSSGQINTPLTTAVVNTTVTGTVTLPQQPPANRMSAALLALRPQSSSVVLITPDPADTNVSRNAPRARNMLGFSGDGTQMRPLPPWNRPGSVLTQGLAWSGDGGHLIVARDTAITVYAVDQNQNLRQIAAIPVVAAGVSGAAGRDFWAVTGSVAYYYAWTGLDYREISTRQIRGLSNPVSISSNADQNALVILDGTQVRYYANTGNAYREVPSYNSVHANAMSVALLKDGGYRVLVADNVGQSRRTVYMGITGSAIREVPSLADSLPEDAVLIVSSPWGDRDYAALTGWGVRYRAFDGVGLRADPARSIQGGWWVRIQNSIVYKPDAELVSATWTGKLVNLLYVTMPTVPLQSPGTSFKVQVTGRYNDAAPASTVWEDAIFGKPMVLTTAGYSLAYRIILHTDDENVTPVIENIQLKQLTVQRYQVGDSASGTQLKVRLVR